MINSHKVTKHACTSSWLPLAHSKHHTYHQVTVMNKQQKKQRNKQQKKQSIKTRCLWVVFVAHIAQIAPVNFHTSMPHRSPASEVHASVVTERPPGCLHKFLPRGHQRGNWRKPWMKDVSNLINICHTNPSQVLNLHGMFWTFCLCPSNDIFDINKTNRYWYWGPTARTERTAQT